MTKSFETEQVYFISMAVKQEQHNAFIQDSFHRDAEDNLSLHTVVCRVDNGLNVPNRNETSPPTLHIAATGEELEMLDLAIHDYLSSQGIQYARELHQNATPVETAYHFNLFVPLKFGRLLEENPTDICQRIKSSLSFEVLDELDGSSDTRFNLHTYLSPSEYAQMEDVSDDIGNEELSKFIVTLVESVDEFSPEAERAEFAELLDVSVAPESLV